MATKLELIRMLRNPDNSRVLQALDELREQGWLADGSLANLLFCHVQMHNADLSGADLRGVDFHQAHLQWSDLSDARLDGAKLNRANLEGANLARATLAGVDLFKANLMGATNLTGEQLAAAKRLWGALMPDGGAYDGRFNLPGDRDFALWGRVDPDDPEAMAVFFGVSLDTYLQGQELGRQTAPAEAR